MFAMHNIFELHQLPMKQGFDEKAQKKVMMYEEGVDMAYGYWWISNKSFKWILQIEGQHKFMTIRIWGQVVNNESDDVKKKMMIEMMTMTIITQAIMETAITMTTKKAKTECRSEGNNTNAKSNKFNGNNGGNQSTLTKDKTSKPISLRQNSNNSKNSNNNENNNLNNNTLQPVGKRFSYRHRHQPQLEMAKNTTSSGSEQ
ncbi:hypothetical protein RFI_32352 [Reticulomyxa filosa]|uniref:Uncharacterized protein n=1 Tax=Reticulomyxa filosa TaxID=46433 RepID=X6LSZ9_RETFI|nr:hypothetical protein RFI_32352 [Reticulomyxa filosa]|eukprot:ETO05043.1 hypothetical protein RFI_32352 [Reticulomyxa filosa]